jgi:hypothetical protein
MDIMNSTDNNGIFIRNSKGQFVNGTSGKPFGAKTKCVKNVKEYLTNFLNDKQTELYEIWNDLTAQERAFLFIHISKLIIPKPTEFQSTNQNFNPIEIILENNENQH